MRPFLTELLVGLKAHSWGKKRDGGGEQESLFLGVRIYLGKHFEINLGIMLTISKYFAPFLPILL